MRCAGLLGAMALLAAGPAVAAEPMIVYLFDQNLDALLRIEDLNHDGDTLDAGEVVAFCNDTPPAALGLENSQGIALLGPGEMLACDNFAPANVLHLVDANGDGDALDADEATVWWGGQLPGGGVLEMPVCVTPGPDGAYYVMENPLNAWATNPDAIYRLRDDNGDGDVVDAGEVALWHELSPAGVASVQSSDLEFDAAGYLYYVDSDPALPPRVMRIDPATHAVSVYLNNTTLLALTGKNLAVSFGGQLAYDPDRDELITGAYYSVSSDVLIALRDVSGNGVIDQANEIRVIWDQYAGTHSVYIDETRDLYRAADGSLLWIDQLYDRCWRLCDANEDGDYDDADETLPIYDAALAGAAGQPVADRPLTVVAVLASPPVCRGDANCDGAVGFEDIDYFVAAIPDNATAWAALFDGPPPCPFENCDVNASGNVGFDDIDPFVGLIPSVCP